jgi:DoxX-like protein
MYVAYIVVAALLSVLLVFSAIGKLTKNETQVKSLAKAGVPLKMLPPLAALEIAGAIGLVIGIFWAPLGIAAAIGVVLYFVGAIIAHIRASDVKGISGPAPVLVLAAAALVLRVVSL